MYDYHQYITMCTMPTLNIADWRWGLEEEKRQALALLVGCSSVGDVGVPPRLEKPGCKKWVGKWVWKWTIWECRKYGNYWKYGKYGKYGNEQYGTMMVFKQENLGIIGDVEVMAYHRCHHRSEIRWSVGDSPHYDSAFSGLRWFPHCPWFKPIWIAKMEIGWTIPKCLKPPNSYHTYSTLPFHIVVQSPFLLVVTSPFRSHFFGWLPADHLRPQAYHIGGYISHCIPIVVGLFWLSNPGSRAFRFVKNMEHRGWFTGLRAHILAHGVRCHTILHVIVLHLIIS